MKKYGAEFIGTFALVFAGTGAITINDVSGGAVTHVGIALTFILEIILTALLMFVILNVSTGPKERGTTAGIAVGSVIVLEALFAGPICGASMNPVRSLAPALVTQHFADLWIYLVAPTAGA
jgi:aquaporin NIP